jgi:short-subunit dehydrogenase
MKHLKNKVVVITGAGSGIGKALAIQFAREGCSVAINDINGQYLQETVDLVHAIGGKASPHLADIACRESVKKFSQEVIDQYGRVDLLINNAGVSIARMNIQEISWEYWEYMMNVNFWGTLNCTKIFYPHLQNQPEAHIVNISSIYSLSGVRDRGPYCASKFAVRGLTETMIQEARGTNVRITSVLPGGVSSKIAFHSKGYKDTREQKKIIEMQERFSKTSPEKAAQIIIRGIKKNKKRILIGWDSRLMDFVIWLFPKQSGKIIDYTIIKAEKKALRNFMLLM